MNILLLEDSITCAQLFIETARRLRNGTPWTVTHVTSFVEADKCWRSFDIVVTDLDLPDSKPDRTIEWISSISPHVPVAVYSGNQQKGIVDRCLSAGAAGFVPKNSMTDQSIYETLKTAVALSSQEELQRRLTAHHEVCTQL